VWVCGPAVNHFCQKRPDILSSLTNRSCPLGEFATHCNTLQYTDTQCTILQESLPERWGFAVSSLVFDLQYRVVLRHTNWQIENAVWNLAGFLHCAFETRWQRFGQFLHDFLDYFFYENLNFLYENLRFPL